MKYSDLCHKNSLLAVKSVKQCYQPSQRVKTMLEIFRCMVNDSIKIGLETDSSSMKRLSTLSYRQLKKYRCYSAYRLTAISKAAGILASRKKSLRRGRPTKTPFMSNAVLVSCSAYNIQGKKPRLALGHRACDHIPLSPHTVRIVSAPS